MPQTPTPNRGLPAPALTDVADGPDAFDDLRAALDNVAGIGWDTLANRPLAVGTVGTAIGCPGTFFWATDTSQLFLSIGSQWQDLSGASSPPIPIGASMEYGGAGDPSDSRWLLEDGRELLRAGTYAPLFGVLSTTYGAGNGTTTFNIPDSRGRVTVGPDNMGTARGAAGRLPSSPNGRGNVGGSELHSHTGATPDHNHWVAGVDHLHYCPGVDHLHGAGSYYVPNHAHHFDVNTSAPINGTGSRATGAFTTVTEGHQHNVAGDTWGSGNFGIGGASAAADRSLAFYSGAADRSLGHWSAGADRSLAFTTSNVSQLQPYVVKNKIIRVR